MARPRQDDPSPLPDRELALRDRAETERPQEQAPARPGIEEPLNPVHAGLRADCSATLRAVTLRLKRPARGRTPLHRSRPSEAAEARFVWSRHS